MQFCFLYALITNAASLIFVNHRNIIATLHVWAIIFRHNAWPERTLTIEAPRIYLIPRRTQTEPTKQLITQKMLIPHREANRNGKIYRYISPILLKTVIR